MGCQKVIAEQIIKQKVDDVLALKGNHSGIQVELEAWWHKSQQEGLLKNLFEKHTKISTGHYRIETRMCHRLLVNINWSS